MKRFSSSGVAGEDLSRQGEFLFRRLSEANPIGIVTADDHRILTANQEFLRLTGYTRADFHAGRINWSEITPLEYGSQDLQKLKELKRQGWHTPVEKEYYCKDGSRVPVLLGGALLHRQPFAYSCFVVDLGARKQAEAALAENEKRLRLALDAANAGTWSWEVASNVSSWDDNYHQLYGFKPREKRTFETWINRVHPEDRGRLMARVRALVKTGAGNTWNEEFRALIPGRGERWMGGWGRVERTAGGTAVRMHGINLDITALKQAEAALRQLNATLERRVAERTDSLRESKQELADFFATAPLGLLWVDPQGLVLRVNQAQLDLLECAETAVLGQPIGQFGADPEIVADLLRRLARRETVRDFRARLQGETLRHVLIDANGLWDKRRFIHSRWFVRDITRQVEMEQEILAISEREQRRIAHDLHDDLCQQLSGAQFRAHALASNLAANSRAECAEARKLAEMVRSALEKTRDLSRSLSPVELEADGLVMAFQQLCAHVEEVFRRRCVFHGKSFSSLPAPEAGIHLYRIAQETINNAIKHGRASRIDITLAVKRGKLILAICDNGLGLPARPEIRKGMGLRVMQYRAAMLGGTLVVRRRSGGGTEVLCSVPRGLP